MPRLLALLLLLLCSCAGPPRLRASALELVVIDPREGRSTDPVFVRNLSTDQEWRDLAILPQRQERLRETLVRRLTGDNGSHVVSYGTEAGQFQAGGYSAVICGPGDIAQAHQPNEFISVAQFEAGWTFIQALVADLAR